MARRRPLRIRRKASALGLLLLLLLLFELNRFLPGVWEGAADAFGPRPRAEALVGEDGTRRAPAETGPTEGMRAPPKRPPPDIPRGGAVVELRLPDGSAVREWGFGAGETGPVEPVPDSEHGRRRLPPSAIREPLRARAGGSEVRHHPLAAGAVAGHWIVVLPDGESRPGRLRDRFTLRALLGEAPVFEARVRVRTRRKAFTRSLPHGIVDLTGVRTLARATLEGTRAATWFHPRGTGEVVLRAPVTREVTLGAGTAGADGAGFLDARGRPLASRPAGGGRYAVEVPADDAPVFAYGRTGTGMGFLTSAAAPSLPETRVIQVEVTRDGGRPAAGGAAVARYTQALPGGTSEPVELTARAEGDGRGRLTLTVPADRPCTVVVAGGGAPERFEVPAGRFDHRLEAALQPGRALEIRVTDADGDPVRGATVRASVAPGIETHATTDLRGHAALADLPLEPVALFVLAEGFAPGRRLVETTESAAHVALVPGAPLTVVVSDRNGVPLEGVRVEVEPENGPVPVEAPDAPALRVEGERARALRALDAPGGTPAARTDANGRFVEARLAKGPYRVRLYHPAYQPQTVRAVRPAAGRTWFVTLRRRDAEDATPR